MSKNIGGLWINHDNGKKSAFYGRIRGTTFVAFPNGDKKNPKHPDYIIFETHSEDSEDVDLRAFI